MDEMFDSDLDEVFFDKDDFAIDISLDDTTNNENPEIILGLFDSKTEVIFDNRTEYGETSASVPSILIPVIDADKIGFKHIITIKNINYKLHSKDDENAGLIRVYLEKKR